MRIRRRLGAVLLVAVGLGCATGSVAPPIGPTSPEGRTLWTFDTGG